MIKIGIEHEFAFKDKEGVYLDFETADYALFQNIVDEFPYVEGDEKFFDCKSLEKSPKRCYVEGFERYDVSGELIETIPKGLEIRTRPYSKVDALIDDFINSYHLMTKLATHHDLSPLYTSFHPFKVFTDFKQSLSQTEINLRTDKELGVACRSMLTQGFHINVSFCNYSIEQMHELVQKATYYFPFIIPYSFSSPFYNGKTFGGLSFRNYYRADIGSITKLLKRKGKDVIEFSGFDTCGDMLLLKSMLLLFKGLLLDKTLTKRAATQDAELVKLSALKGFEDESIKKGGLMVLEAAKAALEKDEAEALEFLETMLLTNDSYAKRMIQTYRKTGDVMQRILDSYKGDSE